MQEKIIFCSVFYCSLALSVEFITVHFVTNNIDYLTHQMFCIGSEGKSISKVCRINKNAVEKHVLTGVHSS